MILKYLVGDQASYCIFTCHCANLEKKNENKIKIKFRHVPLCWIETHYTIVVVDALIFG